MMSVFCSPYIPHAGDLHTLITRSKLWREPSKHPHISLVSHWCSLSLQSPPPPPTPQPCSVLRGRCRFRTTAWPVSWSACVGRSTGWRWSRCATATKRCWTTQRTSWRSAARSRTCCVTSLWRPPSLCPPHSNTWASPRWTSTPDASHCVKISTIIHVTEDVPIASSSCCWLVRVISSAWGVLVSKGWLPVICATLMCTLAWHARGSLGAQTCMGTHP